MVSNPLTKSTRELVYRILTVVLAISLVLALAGVVYIALTPTDQENQFTEFYILGSEGNASDYPTNLTVDETGELIVGITNNEQQQQTYTVVLALEDEIIEQRTVEVNDGATWEDEFVFTAEEPGEKRLDILLFLGDEVTTLEDPYQDLRLVIEIRE